MQKFQSVHYLRGVAALMVVVLHIHTGIGFMRHDAADLGWLRGGVDIFFIISGFVMVKSTTGKAVVPRDFFFRRCQRIVPLYWLVTLVMMTSMQGEFFFKLASMFFVPMANPDTGYFEPVVELGWTLNFEMYFYMLFAISLLISEKWRFWALAALLIALVVLARIFQPVGIIGFYSNPMVLEFLFGMAIAKFNMRGPAVLIPLGFACMYYLYPVISGRVVSLGLPAALIIMGAAGSEGKVRSYRALNLLGDASYAIYLFHLLALGILVKHWDSLGIDTAYFAAVAIAFVLALTINLHLFLERPIMAYFARKKSQSAARSANTADSIFKRHASNAAFNSEKVTAIAGEPNSTGSKAISTTTSA